MQIRELEERKRAFEQEKHEWESTNGITVDELKRRSLEANSKEYVQTIFNIFSYARYISFSHCVFVFILLWVNVNLPLLLAIITKKTLQHISWYQPIKKEKKRNYKIAFPESNLSNAMIIAFAKLANIHQKQNSKNSCDFFYKTFVFFLSLKEKKSKSTRYIQNTFNQNHVQK